MSKVKLFSYNTYVIIAIIVHIDVNTLYFSLYISPVVFEKIILDKGAEQQDNGLLFLGFFLREMRNFSRGQLISALI
jgi:hypothetical protein